MKIFLLVCSLMVCHLSNVHAMIKNSPTSTSLVSHAIHDMKTLEQINPYLKPGQSILVWDLDNTVFTPDLSAPEDSEERKLAEKATDGSYYKTKNHYIHDLHDSEADGYRKAVDEWNEAVLNGVRERPVESLTVEWIHSRQREGYKMLAVTAREPVLASSTRHTMAELGIDLTMNGVMIADRLEFPTEGELFPEPALWENEVFYVGRGGVAHNHKGRRFVRLLKELKIKPPAHVIFIDDRKGHVDGIVEELKKIGIPCDGFVYHAIEAEAEQ